MISYKELEKKDLEKIVEIDRSEDLDESYILVNGELKVVEVKKDFPNWNEEKRLEVRNRIESVIDNGGVVFGAYQADKLVGLASLSKRIITKNRVQLVTFHVDKSHRRMGIGSKLFELIVSEAKTLNVSGIYVSASSRKRTVDFYLHKGCVLTQNIDEELFKEEPKDIHLEYMFS